MRYELKYKLEKFSLDAALQAIRLHPAGFRKAFPDRQINNIYFDTPGLTTLEENVSGIANRKKFRVRWYGTDPTLIQSPRYEIKIKQNMLGDKVVQPVDAFSLDNLKEITQTINRLSGINHGLKPVLLNSYVRSYFTTSDAAFRITVDRELRYHSLLLAPVFRKYLIEDPDLVLELKYDESIDGETDRVTQHLPFRQTKSSKYVTGVYLTNY